LSLTCFEQLCAHHQEVWTGSCSAFYHASTQAAQSLAGCVSCIWHILTATGLLI